MIVMSSFKSPAYNVKAVPVEKIVANSYNPNVVAPPEMKLLELSIWEDGYTMPLVCYYREEEDIRDTFRLTWLLCMREQAGKRTVKVR